MALWFNLGLKSFFIYFFSTAYIFLKASTIFSLVLAPVKTIFPDTNINNTILVEISLYINPGNISGSYYTKALWSCSKLSKFIGNFTSVDPTIF